MLFGSNKKNDQRSCDRVHNVSASLQFFCLVSRYHTAGRLRLLGGKELWGVTRLILKFVQLFTGSVGLLRKCTWKIGGRITIGLGSFTRVGFLICWLKIVG